ncbi:ankyrin repeat domain-containing protein [Zobellia galactanivorans]|uniref:ankyrin repeat domain-containing protein n=1 Tax=Zobellia galactanivorans (strain DSM 12802 / CCUG 47099 / CIP 106680 / NCIMB 13871 / Dsij) TaxID=63186 RepID=UPI0026E36BB5|nr:ankyrin repeat domain-containing protein [Zobellia galactanivorans]MDO6811166.1 ankyrin repeat domain-containing protein [Zobellia galactanivorans]
MNMKINILRTLTLVLGFALVSVSAMAQRNAPRDPNPFLNKDYWEKQPSIGTIQATIKEGHSVTEANRGGFDATTFAIFSKNPISTVQFLMDQGNDINKRTHDSRTYVFWAASSGNLELVKYLIDKGAKLDLVDSHGYGPISFTAATGQENTAIYDAFIEGGVDLKKEKDHHGKNALLTAIGRAKNLDVVDYFIGKGLSLNSVDDHGNGAFHYAAQGGNIDILKELVKRGVSTAKNESTGENAIFFASKGRGASVELFKYLEGLGLNANVSTKKGENPLHNLASSSKDVKVFKYFEEKGVDPNAVDEEGNTPLLKAAARNELSIVKYLAEKTKNIDHSDSKGQTALAVALQNNSADVVSYLISKGADVQVKDHKGDNLAAYLFGSRGKPHDFDAKVAALKAKGFDFKQLQADNSSVWHLAVSKNNLDLLKKVSAFGADINGKDKDGNTPLHYAAMKTENAEILKYLIKNGADLKSTTEFGETAHDLASENELLAKNKVNLQFLN